MNRGLRRIGVSLRTNPESDEAQASRKDVKDPLEEAAEQLLVCWHVDDIARCGKGYAHATSRLSTVHSSKLLIEEFVPIGLNRELPAS